MEDILQFWFHEIEPSQHYKKDPEFDSLIWDRFGEIHASATRCELYTWRQSPKGRLAEIIVLDQFSRNMFRDTPQAFGYDSLALILAQEAVLIGADQTLSPNQRGFIYLPFMHSESLIIHERAVELYSQAGMENGLEWEMKHKSIIEKFGRYPHRNEILGRTSSSEEIDFLKQPGSSF